MSLPNVTRLVLTFGSQTANIANLQRGGYSRSAISGQYHVVSQTLNNNAVVSGTYGENKLQWDLLFWATEAVTLDLKEIALLSKLSPNPSIDLIDLVTPVIDTPTLTRAVAPTPNNAITTRNSGYASYFARFNVLITEFSPNQKIVGYDCDNLPYWEVSLQLTEGDKTG